ncbi:MASE3 domain-containing protein [Desulfobacterales bacterium HSG2]|nr:MASE3 domain-containing protein [Desulfobacterales bacterium HSG2]
MKYSTVTFGVLILFGLHLANLYSFLLFHSFAELFSIVVACAIFMIAWNTRGFMDNNYLRFLAVAYLFVAGIDLLHTLAYKGMGIFSGYNEADLSTQLWICARYMESISLFIALFFTDRNIKIKALFYSCTGTAALLLLSVFHWHIFPNCFIEGEGLTLFKKVSEYVICLILGGTIALMFRKRGEFDAVVFKLMVASVSFTIVSELTFTLYLSVYDIFNLIGHYFKLISFYLIYKAIIVTGLVRPYSLLFRKLKQSEESLRESESKLHKAKEAAEAANRAKTEFLSNMGHEFRTPLNIIMGYTQMFKRDKNLSEGHRYAVSSIHRSSEHLLTMINDVLDFSGIEAGKLELEPRDFHLPGFLKNIKEITETWAWEKGIVFDCEFAPDLPTGLHGDTRRLRQILLNLLGNAVKFSNRDSIVFRVYPESPPDIGTRRISFEVEDMGIGIPNNNMGDIFLPFCQLNKVQTEGTGLGLTISHRLLSLMGSELYVKSATGMGSTFCFCADLPEVSCAPAVGKAKELKDAVGFKGDKPRILIADSLERNRTVLKDMILPLGFEIIEASDGRDALDKTIKFCPDLILLELLMPLMNGFEVIKEIRKTPRLENLPIIAISKEISIRTKDAGLMIGCDDFFSMPLHKEVLLERLQSYLKLEWIYEDESENQETDIQPEEEEEEEIIIPPEKEELDLLLNMAMKGDIFGIQEQTEAIRASDPEMIPFEEKISGLAKEFLIDEIQEFIEQFYVKEEENV